MTKTKCDDALTAELAKFDTPTVCNVIELFDVRPRNAGYMNDSIQACFPSMPPMVGYAVTATFRSMKRPRGSDGHFSLKEQVDAFAEQTGPAVMVFQDLDQPVVSATFGEVMCSTYRAFGAAGIITSGAGRDLQQVQALGFPAFTSGTICSHGYCHMPSMNIPVSVGGIWIEPGELIHGDCNGVTTIPREIASEIPEACREFMTAEQVVLDYVNGEQITPAGMVEARKQCADMIAKLAGRLGRK